MGRRSVKIELTVEERVALEKGYKGTNPFFGKRCHMLLLKSEGFTSAKIAEVLLTNKLSVHNWVNRYKRQGIEGLRTKPGVGRKRILDIATDEQKVRAAIKRERQQLKQVKEELEQELDKKFSKKTLQRFLKSLAADGNESV